MDMGISEYVWEIGADIFESVLFSLFLSEFHSYKKTDKSNQSSFFTYSLISFALFLNIVLGDYFSVSGVVSFIVDFVIVLWFSTRYLKGSVLEHLLSFSLYYLGLFLSVAFSALLLYLLGDGINAWLDTGNMNRHFFLLGSKMFLFIYAVCVLKIRSQFICAPERLEKLSYVIVPFSSFMVGLWLIRLIFILPPVYHVRETILLLLIFLLLLLAFIFYLSVYAARTREKDYENKALMKVLKVQKNAVKSMGEGRTEIWRINHDIGHRIAAVRYLLHEGEADKGFKELDLLCYELNENTRAIMEGEDLGQFVINSKLEDAQNKGILVRKKIRPGYYQGLDPIDFSIILGNLLDNAIEAQEEVNDKWIDFVMDEALGCVFMEIKNAFFAGTRKKKESIGHGYGLSTVRKLVKKYKGRLEIQMEKDEFVVRVLLQVVVQH